MIKDNAAPVIIHVDGLIFSLVQTGGGCMAHTYEDANGYLYMITAANSPSDPIQSVEDPAYISITRPGETEPFVHIQHVMITEIQINS